MKHDDVNVPQNVKYTAELQKELVKLFEIGFYNAPPITGKGLQVSVVEVTKHGTVRLRLEVLGQHGEVVAEIAEANVPVGGNMKAFDLDQPFVLKLV